ncbi:MAG: TrmJ/YjtD family RNA methyltransferase [Nitrososphaerales archaeon]
MKLSVTMIEPEHEVNVGHVSRVMKNFGVDELLLVKPRFDVDKAKVFAVHGKDLLDKARIVNFNHLRKFDLLIATTAIRSSDRSNVARGSISPSQLSRILVDPRQRVCLVLGRESTGLSNQELSSCDVVVSIDTGTEYRTLNISHALAILLYEIKKRSFKREEHLASVHERELLIDYALKLAKMTGYRRHKIGLLKTAIKRFAGRNMLSSKEAMLMVTLFRQALLTLERRQKENPQAITFLPNHDHEQNRR